jgi:histone demethylase JARID1
MYSVNYMHEGAGKTWYTVPTTHTEQMRALMRKWYAKQLVDRKYLLTEVVITFNPVELLKEGIPVYKAYQSAGEVIVTFPGAFHTGFSNGYNIAEAVNLATPDWVEFAYKHQQLNKTENYVKRSCFSIEWIVISTMENLETSKFSDHGKKCLIRNYLGILEQEIAYRKVVKRNFLDSPRFSCEVLERGKLKYWDVACIECRYYIYLSYFACKGCNGVWCVDHADLGYACCGNGQKVLYCRDSDQDLMKNYYYYKDIYGGST